MTIQDKEIISLKVGDLDDGMVFRYNDFLYMRICETDDDNCVCLQDGKLEHLRDDIRVELVEGKFVVE